MACGVNPHGYHGINFGGFVPKYSFKVKQQLAASKRGVASDEEDVNRSKRRPGLSLPEIKVKRLMKESKKKKRSRSHTFDSASSERLRLPTIAQNGTTVRRGRGTDGGGGGGGEGRVVKNGEPWWKWTRKNQGREQLPRFLEDDVDTYGYDDRAVPLQKAMEREKFATSRHNLRQKLPPLVGYRDGKGNLLYSETCNNAAATYPRSHYSYHYGIRNYYAMNSAAYLNRRYYYSRSRSGIRPRHSGAKVTVSQACLFAVGGNRLQLDSRHHEAVLDSMQEELQDVPGLHPTDGFLNAHMDSLNSNIGAKLKRSLAENEKNLSRPVDDSSRDLKKSHHKVDKRQAVEINMNGLPVNESQDHSRARCVKAGIKHRKQRAMAILDALIDIVNSTQFVQATTDDRSTRHGMNGAPGCSQTSLNHVNVGDFFQRPEAEIRKYDRFKQLYNHVRQCHESLHATNGTSELKGARKCADNVGLTQLLAIQRLQASFESISNDDRNSNVTSAFTETYNNIEDKQKRLKSIQDRDPTRLMYVDLNDQFLEFSKEGGLRRQRERSLANHKLVRNVSVEAAERRRNSRPDLEVNGERLKHLYELGLFDGDQELREIAEEAAGRVSLSREQLSRIQELCDRVTVTSSPVSNTSQVKLVAVGGGGYLEQVREEEEEEEGKDGSSCDGTELEERDYYSRPEAGTVSFDVPNVYHDGSHSDNASLDVEVNVESEDENLNGRERQMDGLTHNSRSYDLEIEFAKSQAMDLQQRLQMKQVMKEKRVLESVRKDLKHFQETLHSNTPKQPAKQRESLLPPPLPPRKKTKPSPSRTPRRKAQQQEAEDHSMSSDMSSVCVDRLDGNGGREERENETESGCELLEDGEIESSVEAFEAVDNDEDCLDPDYEMIERAEGDEEEEVDACFSDPDMIDDATMAMSSCVALNDEQDRGEYEDRDGLDFKASQRSGYDLDRSDKSKKATSNLVDVDPLTEMDVDEFNHSYSGRGMRGSSLPKSRRGKRYQSSGSRPTTVNEDVASLAVSRPESTVKPLDLEPREQVNSRQGSRLPTREKMGSRGRTVLADPTQMLAHRKSQLAKQQLVEAREREARLEEERELKRQEKMIRQKEIEEKLSESLEQEQEEIRRQRQLKAEARKRAEELEEQRQLLITQMVEQEKQREAQEKAKHLAMLESLRKEADMRQQMLFHEKEVMDEHQRCIDVWNEWEYSYIDYYLGGEMSQKARKVDQLRELETKQLLQQRMVEVFELKRRELLEKLKVAQKQLMQDLAMDKGQLDHFLKISRAFVFSYFERVSDQTYMVPQELLM